jgi:signal transduction histidine kinase/CheY-like chemotaxis protein
MTMTPKQHKGASWFWRLDLRSRFLLVIYCLTLGSVAMVGYFGYQSASQAYQSKAEELLSGYTLETGSKMDTFQETALADLAFFANYHALTSYLYWQLLDDPFQAESQGARVNRLFLEFLNNSSFYQRLSFYDLDGQERLGVRRDPQSNKAVILKHEHLEPLKAGPFLEQGRLLNKGETYASPLAPYIEQGQTLRPILPVVRFVTPVISANGTRHGMLVAQVRAEEYFKFARQANAINPDRQFFIINDHGQYLFHADPAKVFAQVQGMDANFKRDFPDIGDQAPLQEERIILHSQGRLLSFRHIHPNAGRHENGFILVGTMDEAKALAELRLFVVAFFGLLVLVVVLVLVFGRYFINSLMRPLESLTLQLQRMERGEIWGWAIDYRGEDEIRRMLDSNLKLMTNLEALANQADIISKGDFSTSVPLLSDEDRLGKAINNMTLMLRDAREEERQDTWLKEGLNQLSLALTADMRPDDFAEVAISRLGRYLEAGRGVLYRLDRHNERLELLGSYMYREREALHNSFALGEGAVGQVARERKPIILHAQMADQPLVTGTLSLPPLHSYTYPLLREGQLLGVIELASFHALDKLALDYLAQACDILAAFFYSVDQQEQIRVLLAKSEEAQRLTQEQNRRLQESNVLMEEQQQQLQQQAAELQATNTQMEEQQQQLQQQAVELRASNTQMEEQQQQLEQRNHELNRSREELDNRARQLELSGQYKSEFLANMSHELRTPLNSIILLAKLMATNEEGQLKEEDAKRAEVIHRAGQELLRLINDVLDLSKVEAGRMELVNDRFHSSELAEEFGGLFGESARDKGLELIIEDRIQGELLLDRAKLAQILRNLLANALKFTRKGHIRLLMEQNAGAALPLCFSVQDSGIGIPRDKQALIFEAFHQGDGSTSREFGGTGLGLSISRSLTELMGGQISLESAADLGSTFRVCLPQEPATQPTMPSPRPSAKPSLKPEAAPATISASAIQDWPADDRASLGENDQVLLLIDDDPLFAQIILDINRRLGYRTLLAGTAQEGEALAKRYQPNGILLDLGLPDMDGAELLGRLKTTPQLASIPVYIVSGRDRDQALMDKGGALGYLHKPVNHEQIASAEAEILAQYQQGGQQPILLIENGDLSQAQIAEWAGLDRAQVVSLAEAEALARLDHALKGQSFRLAILDLGKGTGQNGALDATLKLTRALRERLPEIAILFYSQKPLTDEAEARLRPYSDSIIIKTPQAEARLQDNIQAFLRQVPQRQHGTTRAMPPGSGTKRLAGHKILVVDDDPRNLFVITAALEQHGAKVDNALNGRRALEHLALNRPDLVIMDIMMPEMDGYKTIQAIRADAAIKDIPILALTAKALPKDRDKVLALGADDYLAKPADYEVLVNMAAAWCQGRRTD